MQMDKPARYVKKPVVIEAIQYNGRNVNEVKDFTGGLARMYGGEMRIHTLEGDMIASPSDMIIKGIKGEFYPCKYDIFIESYSVAEIPFESALEDAPAPEENERLKTFLARPKRWR